MLNFLSPSCNPLVRDHVRTNMAPVALPKEALPHVRANLPDFLGWFVGLIVFVLCLYWVVSHFFLRFSLLQLS